jgi:hypothetical protein
MQAYAQSLGVRAEAMWKNLQRQSAVDDLVACESETYDYIDETDMMMSGMTTIMLCNIPCRVSLHEITDAVRCLGYEGTYDLLHVPGPRGRRRGVANSTNIGYAFINFVKPEDAQNFLDAFQGFCFQGRQSDKVGIAKFARVQGFEKNFMLLNRSSAQCVLPYGIPGNRMGKELPSQALDSIPLAKLIARK